MVTDAAFSFPTGEAFVVYPGKTSPLVSLRLEVFYEALQNLRALEMLEKHIGRVAVLEILEKGLSSPITFDEYLRETGWLLSKRAEINGIVESATATDTTF